MNNLNQIIYCKTVKFVPPFPNIHELDFRIITVFPMCLQKQYFSKYGNII